MLFGKAGLVDFTSWQSTPNRTFADPVQDALYDSGPRPLVVSGELWAEVILLLDDLPDENWGCDVVEDKCPQTAKRAGRD